MEWIDETAWTEQALAALDNRGPLLDALRWNAGAYLWFSGLSDSLESGLQTADDVLKTGQALQCLDQLRSWRSHLSIR